MGTDLLVLHDVGAPGGREWATAFIDWPGLVIAPDLPGHNGAPPPVGGNYEVGDAVYVALDLLRNATHESLVVMGIGQSGAAAQTLALGGRADGVVLVDGLGGPWLDPHEVDVRERELRRRIATTPDALAEPPIDAIDLRATMVLGAMKRDFAVRQARSMPVPTLVIETPASPTPDSDMIAGEFADAHAERVGSRDARGIAELVNRWWAARRCRPLRFGRVDAADIVRRRAGIEGFLRSGSGSVQVGDARN
ncbi:MAG: alpha/beta hydrolase [Actinomycetota bacterium]